MFRDAQRAVGVRAALLTGALLIATPAMADERTQSGNELAVELAASMLCVDAYETFTLDLPDVAGQFLTLEIPIGNEKYTVDLWEHRIRSANYQLLAHNAQNELVSIDPTPIQTYQGEIAGDPGSRVAITLLPNGMNGVIHTSDGPSHWIEAVNTHVPGAPDGLYITYEESNCHINGTCGTRGALDTTIEEFEDSPLQGGEVRCAQLAIDCDYQFYGDWNFSVASVEARVTSVINTMNNQYISDVSIQHEIVTIIVRTDVNTNPYSTNNADTLLDQFRAHWLGNHGGIQRDVAHLFTGRNLDGSTIGIAWLQAVCTTLAYSLVENDNSLFCQTDLCAHELGHNWGAPHCDCITTTMHPFQATCANDFATTSINSINNYENSIQFCLTDCGPPPPEGYCEAGASFSGGPHISRIQFGTIDNSSGTGGGGGYSDFTDQSTTVVTQQEYQLTIETTGADSTYRAGVWIDWNNDEDFNDFFEVVTESLEGAGPHVVNILVPTFSQGPDYPGRLRVRLQDNLTPVDPCGLTSVGEVEDYAINIQTIPDPIDCPEDIDGSGTIDFGDALIVLTNWGPCSGCDADINDSGFVDFGDLLSILTKWGDC